MELKAMGSISDFINSNPNRKCNLLPVKVVKEEDIEKNKQISDSYIAIHKDHAIGFQQERLSRLALQMGSKLVQGIESGPGGTGHVSTAIRKYATIIEGSITLERGERIEFCELDPSRSTKEITDIFGGVLFLLPLWEITKLQTLEEYKKIGYESVIPMTWFCAQPFMGKPCGLCNPCNSTIKADMGFRIPKRSRVLNKLLIKNRIGNYLFVKLRLKYYKYR